MQRLRHFDVCLSRSHLVPGYVVFGNTCPRARRRARDSPRRKELRVGIHLFITEEVPTTALVWADEITMDSEDFEVFPYQVF